MKYKISYLMKNGDSKQETIEAPGIEKAREVAGRLGFVLSLAPCGEPGGALFKNFFNGFGLPSNYDIMLFTRELATLLKAGLTMPEALETIERHIGNVKLKNAIVSMRNDIVSGSSFAHAVAGNKDVFSDLYCRCVSGGETSSGLIEVLNLLSLNLKKSHQMNSKLFNIAVYPAMILAITFAVFGFLTFYVIPSFENVFYEMRIEIPYYTEFFFLCARSLKKYVFHILILLPVAGVLMIAFGLDVMLKSVALKLLRAAPFSSRFVKLHALFTFSGMLSALLKSGSNAFDSFSVSIAAFGLLASQSQRESALEVLKSGGRLSDAITALGMKDEALVRMSAVGERSGRLEEMMDVINEYYLESLENGIERLAAVI